MEVTKIDTDNKTGLVKKGISQLMHEKEWGNELCLKNILNCFQDAQYVLCAEDFVLFLTDDLEEQMH